MGALVTSAVPAGATPTGEPAATTGRGPAPTAAGDLPTVRRVLILTLPTVTWADLEAADTPNLDRLLRRAALAGTVVRAGGRRAAVGNAYLTVGAGTRAVGSDDVAGQALQAGERVSDTPPADTLTAAEVFAARTGRRVRGGIVHLGIARLAADNAASDYGATPGALGDALAAAGIRAAVIANADGTAPWTGALPASQRAAATAVMTSAGTVPAGTVRATLLEASPADAFGVRLSIPAVEQAFRQVWRGRAVVLVEASDLWRANQAAPLALPAAAARQQARALAHTDALVGTLLRSVDLRRDAVIVVGLAIPTAKPPLGVGALRAPGVPAGLLRSATTRRTGFVHLVDVAPTVLALTGVERPDGMEGRVMQPGRTGGAFRARVAELVDAAADGARRDGRVGEAVLFLVVAVLVVAAGALAAEWRWPAVRPVVAWAALSVPGMLLVPFLLRGLRLDRAGNLAYWTLVLAGAAVFGLLALRAGRRRPADGLLVAMAALVVLHVADVFTGARLELSTPLGYSATIGIRMAGIGNVSFAVTAAAALIVAGLLRARWPDRRGLAFAVATLAVTFVAFTPPFFGQNYGATLASAPAFALCGWLLSGRRVRPGPAAAVAVGLLVAVGAAVAGLEMLRGDDDRTHVGRFAEQVGEQGWSGLSLVLGRKGEASLATVGGSWIGWALPIAAVLVVVLVAAGRRPLRRVAATIPELVPVGVGLGVLGVLGFALNDSGIVIPSLVAALMTVAVAYLVSVDRIPGSPAPAPSRSQSGRRTPAAVSAAARRRFGSS